MSIIVDDPVTAVSTKTNDIQCFEDILRYKKIKQIICNPSIIIIKELLIFTIFVAN